MSDVLEQLAESLDLKHMSGTSRGDNLPERYLYSNDMDYRYAFGRWWGAQDLATSTVWVLLNPATGDTEQRRRPTLERCIKWSRRVGDTGLVIVNLFAYRDTNPKNLRAVADPVGPANDAVLRAVTAAGSRTVAAWGRDGRLLNRDVAVAPLLTAPLCLGTTRQGQPLHPLLVPGATEFRSWAPQ